MCSNRRRIFSTVKFRIAFWYAVLFAVTGAVSLAFVFVELRRTMLRGIDRALERGVRNYQIEYLTGKRHQQFDREVPLDRLAPEARRAFEERFPGVQLLLVFETRNAGGLYQTAFGTVNHQLFELRLESDGSVYSRRIDPAYHLPLLRQTLDDAARAEGANNLVCRLLSASGKVEAGTPLSPGNGFPPADPAKQTLRTVGQYRVLQLPLFDGGVLEAARSLEATDRLLREYVLTASGVFLALLAVSLLVGWLLAGKFLAGIRRVSQAAREIAGGDFSRRVESHGDGSEIEELVEAFNTMNANTERLFEELRTVTDDVAHDLRTPLTRIRGLAEITVSGPQELARYQEMAAVTAEECAGMLQIINTMLEITRMEHAIETLECTRLDWAELLRRAEELYQPSAEDLGIRLEFRLPEHAWVFADRLKLQRAAANLLDNALKFTPSGGTVTVTLEPEETQWLLRVADTGCGIAPENIEHVFERFFRSDPSRSRPGNGLGLSLVRAIALAHGGSVEVSSELGRGTEFRFRLPKAEELPGETENGK